MMKAGRCGSVAACLPGYIGPPYWRRITPLRSRRRSQHARDQYLHDLVGTAEDASDASVLVHAGDRIFVHIAVAAVELQALVDDLALQVGDPILRHRGGRSVELALQVLLDAVIDEDSRDRRLGLAFGELELDRLVVDDRLAEGLALLDVVDGDGKRALDHGDAVNGDD